MQNLERRVSALEAGNADPGVAVVILGDSETKADALKREGVAPGSDVVFVVFDDPQGLG